MSLMYVQQFYINQQIFAFLISRLLNYYPLEKCKTSNLKHRPIGIGVQGLADVFIKMNLPFDSHGARLLNSHIFQHMYYELWKQQKTRH